LDGLLGLAGVGASSAKPNPTLFDNLISQHSVGSMFAFYMKTSSVASVDGSLLIIGEPNATIYAPSGYHWVPSYRTAGSIWTVNLDNVVTGGTTLGICAAGSRSCRALIDSGTSIIGVPSGNSWIALVNSFTAARSDCGQYSPDGGEI
jgi:hypothetical protein